MSRGLSTGVGQRGSHGEQCALKPILETESQDTEVCHLFSKQKQTKTGTTRPTGPGAMLRFPQLEAGPPQRPRRTGGAKAPDPASRRHKPPGCPSTRHTWPPGTRELPPTQMHVHPPPPFPDDALQVQPMLPTPRCWPSYPSAWGRLSGQPLGLPAGEHACRYLGTCPTRPSPR